MTADEQRQYSQWDVIAEEEGFVVVFPEGVPDSPSQLRKEIFSDNKILLLGLMKSIYAENQHYNNTTNEFAVDET